MMKNRDYGKLAADIKNAIGEQNIISATYCATRLRLFLREDPGDDITRRIEQMPGVIQVVKAGGQYQIVIGLHAKDVYEELSKRLASHDDKHEMTSNSSLFRKVIAPIVGAAAFLVSLFAGGNLWLSALIGIAIACIPAFVFLQTGRSGKSGDSGNNGFSEENKTLKDTTVYAPMNGRVIPLAEVPDEVFSSGMLGRGVAIDPSEGRLYAPFDGTVSSVFDTKHAFTLTNKAGAEMLIHIGIDTVQLGGRYFTPKVADGTEVRKGDLLAEFDLNAIRREYKTITPILMTNGEDYASIDIIKDSGDVRVGDRLYIARA